MARLWLLFAIAATTAYAHAIHRRDQANVVEALALPPLAKASGEAEGEDHLVTVPANVEADPVPIGVELVNPPGNLTAGTMETFTWTYGEVQKISWKVHTTSPTGIPPSQFHQSLDISLCPAPVSILLSHQDGRPDRCLFIKRASLGSFEYQYRVWTDVLEWIYHLKSLGRGEELFLRVRTIDGAAEDRSRGKIRVIVPPPPTFGLAPVPTRTTSRLPETTKAFFSSTGSTLSPTATEDAGVSAAESPVMSPDHPPSTVHTQLDSMREKVETLASKAKASISKVVNDVGAKVSNFVGKAWGSFSSLFD
ncbi:hypothetical protein HDU67_000437 [Dinochytrium kinnereticum]|nr:hypothetical protein HDU67_000437 [Dinochytrium kinnereticum]